MQQSTIYKNLDLKQALSSNRVLGLWRLMSGFQWIYIGAIVTLAIATLAKTLTYILLEYFVDDVLNTILPDCAGFRWSVRFSGSFHFPEW
jgi:hypothetical protein